MAAASAPPPAAPAAAPAAEAAQAAKVAAWLQPAVNQSPLKPAPVPLVVSTLCITECRNAYAQCKAACNGDTTCEGGCTNDYYCCLDGCDGFFCD
jgi:hypothetical protein